MGSGRRKAVGRDHVEKKSGRGKQLEKGRHKEAGREEIR
jgi:hypothetical protein